MMNQDLHKTMWDSYVWWLLDITFPGGVSLVKYASYWGVQAIRRRPVVRYRDVMSLDQQEQRHTFMPSLVRFVQQRLEERKTLQREVLLAEIAQTELDVNASYDLVYLLEYLQAKLSLLDGKVPEGYTCSFCRHHHTCKYAWDAYNKDGDCLAEK